MIITLTSLMRPCYLPISLFLLVLLLPFAPTVSSTGVCVNGKCTPPPVPRHCIPARRPVHGRHRRHIIPQAHEDVHSRLAARGNGICYYPTSVPCRLGVETARFVLPLGRYALNYMMLVSDLDGMSIPRAPLFPLCPSPLFPCRPPPLSSQSITNTKRPQCTLNSTASTPPRASGPSSATWSVTAPCSRATAKASWCCGCERLMRRIAAGGCIGRRRWRFGRRWFGDVDVRKRGGGKGEWERMGGGPSTTPQFSSNPRGGDFGTAAAAAALLFRWNLR